MWCKYCDEGDEPHVLDIDGVRSEISGTPGCWGHAHEDAWWPCQRKAAEEHAIVEAMNKLRENEAAPEEGGDFYTDSTRRAMQADERAKHARERFGRL